jgi:hypothetical protein
MAEGVASRAMLADLFVLVPLGRTDYNLQHRIRSESPDGRHSELAYRRRLVRQLQLRGSLSGTFAQAPDNGFCESVLFWHVREGHYGDVKLDNLSFVRVGRWEGDLWARNATGVAGLYIDDHADDRQMEALPAIIGGRAGGFPGWVNECFAGGRQSRGIERAKITYEIAPDLGHWGVEIVGKVKAWAKAIIGPTSPPGKYPQLMNAPGSETGPGPQLVTWGKSTILSVDAHGFKFEYTLNSAKHIPFDWVGP